MRVLFSGLEFSILFDAQKLKPGLSRGNSRFSRFQWQPTSVHEFCGNGSGSAIQVRRISRCSRPQLYTRFDFWVVSDYRPVALNHDVT